MKCLFQNEHLVGAHAARPVPPRTDRLSWAVFRSLPTLPGTSAPPPRSLTRR